MTVRAKSECRTVWLSCMCVCTCAFALVSHYPEIETNRAGSALRSKPPHRLPLTSQPSKGASVCGCGCFHLALYEVCVSHCRLGCPCLDLCDTIGHLCVHSCDQGSL